MYGNPSPFERFFVMFLVMVVRLASYLPDKYLEVYEKRDKRRWENRAGSLDKYLPPDVPVDEVVKHAKYGECSYSNKCRLCGEEVVWSVVEHFLDKHSDHPVAKELSKKIGELWDKFVESS